MQIWQQFIIELKQSFLGLSKESQSGYLFHLQVTWFWLMNSEFETE